MSTLGWIHIILTKIIENSAQEIGGMYMYHGPPSFRGTKSANQYFCVSIHFFAFFLSYDTLNSLYSTYFTPKNVSKSSSLRNGRSFYNPGNRCKGRTKPSKFSGVILKIHSPFYKMPHYAKNIFWGPSLLSSDVCRQSVLWIFMKL